MAAAISSTLFGLSVKSVFDSWTALQLAVSHGFGGSDSHAKADWLVYATETWFTENENIESYEVEDFLEQVLNNEFDLLIDDGSLPQVASKICRYYVLCEQGRDAEVRQLISKEPKPALGECKESPQEDQEVDGLASSSAVASESSTAATLVTDGSQPGQTSPINNASTSDSDMEVEEGWEVVRHSKKR